MNVEPINLGRDGADEPPTLIKEDLLSSGSVRQSTSDTQVHVMKSISDVKDVKLQYFFHWNNLFVSFDRGDWRNQEHLL